MGVALEPEKKVRFTERLATARSFSPKEVGWTFRAKLSKNEQFEVAHMFFKPPTIPIGYMYSIVYVTYI